MNKQGSAHSLTHFTHVKDKLQACQVHNEFEENNHFGLLVAGGHETEIAVLIC